MTSHSSTAPHLGNEAARLIGQRLAQRDADALAEAYDAYAGHLLSYLRRLVGPADAEDVMQHTFLDAWRHAERYDPEQRFTGWLFTIAHHRAVDTLRARRHAPVTDPDPARDLVGEDGRDTAERLASADLVRGALAALPAHEQVVLRLAYFEQLSQREIARRLAVPLGTVKARASRGTRRLGRLLREEEAERGVSP